MLNRIWTYAAPLTREPLRIALRCPLSGCFCANGCVNGVHAPHKCITHGDSSRVSLRHPHFRPSCKSEPVRIWSSASAQRWKLRCHCPSFRPFPFPFPFPVPFPFPSLLPSSPHLDLPLQVPLPLPLPSTLPFDHKIVFKCFRNPFRSV